jgi:MFS family permease
MSKEKPVENPTSVSTKEMFVSLLKNKTLFKIIIFNVIWRVIEYLTTPFMGTFQNKELGFSMTFVAALSGVGAITRAVASRPMGKMADKLSFRKMLTLEFVILVVSLGINALSSAQIGKYTYCVYVVLHSVCLAGINSGTINLMYDFVPHEYRTGAYALQNTIAGSCGFLASLLGSAIVDIIQKNGNTLLGIPVYAQQVLSLIAMCIAVVGIVYLSTVIRSLDKKKTDLEQAS